MKRLFSAFSRWAAPHLSHSLSLCMTKNIEMKGSWSVWKMDFEIEKVLIGLCKRWESGWEKKRMQNEKQMSNAGDDWTTPASIRNGPLYRLQKRMERWIWINLLLINHLRAFHFVFYIVCFCPGSPCSGHFWSFMWFHHDNISIIYILLYYFFLFAFIFNFHFNLSNFIFFMFIIYLFIH